MVLQRLRKALKKSLDKDLAYIKYKAEINGNPLSFEEDNIINNLVSLINNKENKTLDLNSQNLKDALKNLKDRKILASILEDYHCTKQPLIMTLMKKLSPENKNQFLKDFYHNENKVNKDIKSYVKNKF